MKTFMVRNKLAEPSLIEIAQIAIWTTRVKQTLGGTRIKGTPESKKDDARCRQEHDFD